MSLSILILINVLIDILNIKAVVIHIEFIMNHLNIIQYIISMKQKSIHLTKSVLYANIKNLMAKFEGKNFSEFSKARYVMVY